MIQIFRRLECFLCTIVQLENYKVVLKLQSVRGHQFRFYQSNRLSLLLAGYTAGINAEKHYFFYKCYEW